MNGQSLEVLVERVRALETKIDDLEKRLVERVSLAFDGHRQLHQAHDIAHQEEHDMNQQAIVRAEANTVETARLHATAHEREHQLAKEAIEKAHSADAIRFEHLNEAKARSQDERATFATRDQLDDKVDALNARVDKLEKAEAVVTGRDKGVALFWGIGIAVFGVIVTIITLVVTLR